MNSGGFGAKFQLVLRALNLSRASVSVAVQVDKSLVGRWASGAITPSNHNLSKLSRFVADHRPGFCMADWDRPVADLADLLGVQLDEVGGVAKLPGFPPAFVDRAHDLTTSRGSAYEGFWRTARPSVMMPGTIFRDHGMIRIAPNGFLTVRMGGAGMMFEGIILPGESNLFAVFYNSVSAAPYFLIAKGVHLPRAEVLEGLLLLSALDAGETPASVPIVLERIGDLTGDRQADDLTCSTLIDRPTVAEPGDVSQHVLDRLIRDVGPAAAAAGGELFLTTAHGGLTRGSTDGGQLRG